MQQDLGCWLKLQHTPGISLALFHKLLGHFGSAAGACNAGASELTQLGLTRNTIEHLHKDGAAESVEAALRWSQQPLNHILTLADSGYPPLLKAIHYPPPLLYVKGRHEVMCEPQLAVVGSRNPSRGGEETAHAFASHMARAGLVITSGLALGIDGAAHRGALDAKGATIGVMATGIDRIYPARHRKLAESIIETGALVTEFPLGTEPLPELFPQRNRIISGLAYGVLVVEAAERSGSLITAHYAMEQAREVFAIPGSLHNPMARGCHRLIRQGAKLVESVEHILEELAPQLSDRLRMETAAAAAPQEKVPELDPDYQSLLQFIDYDPVSIDQMVERSGLPARSISSMLLILELQGLIRAETGGRYCRVR
ncbi:MAG TPA: DNA-processing protein DprA [Gammaproteobacteria bacterium]|nr:DNA-processing protein DprA [Gammaproteobacteria bacterium]